ncbi:MAG TPA: tyrosine-type recombinase/integrase, partial [Actinomycetota bacterium]|nr:tyrosine-type recombinase/integrase [Actinomycetota bacterium]
MSGAAGRLTEPIDDVIAATTPGATWWGCYPVRRALVAGMADAREAFWGWDRQRWLRVAGDSEADSRQIVMAAAYLLCGQRDLHLEFPKFKARLFAHRVFGAEPVETTIAAVVGHLDVFGPRAELGRPNMVLALVDVLLLAGSPLVEDLASCAETLVALRRREVNNARRHGVAQLIRTLVDMGVIEATPFTTQPSREEWLARSVAAQYGVPQVWLEWTRRWFETSTLSRRTRESAYYSLIKAGRWLQRDHPEHADPASWDRELAAAWVAAVDRLVVGDLSKAPNTNYMRARYGGPMSASSKAQLIWTLRRFFVDLQEWEWIERRFDPRRAFVTPQSIQALIGPNPRVIADDVWAKLMWAGLNLAVDDLPSHRCGPWYPLELVRAETMLWLFAGLRIDEISRLRLGAIRWVPDEGDRPAVCLLDVPTNKTGTAFTKPVDRLVGEAVEAWEAVRPRQPRFEDRKTGELVELLFAYRGEPVGRGHVNRVLIPMLCRKAGVPRDDVRGSITGHRARATIATQLYNAKEPMTLFELQAWLGHRSPYSTQHYARITPTALAKAYTDAGYFARNARMIEVLLDRDAMASGAGPFEYYDLGHGYCTYTFFEQCPHRMACARCDFYLPKPSSRAQLLEAKAGLQR